MSRLPPTSTRTHSLCPHPTLCRSKIDAAAPTARIAGIRKDVHQVQPGAISITNATEYGLAWRADEIGSSADVARAGGMKLHMDGARFANALAFLGCAPADVRDRKSVV